MDHDEENPKGFKVEDRRRFSPEGELKPEHRGAEEPTREPNAPASAGAAAASPDSPSGGSASAPETGGSEPQRGARATRQSGEAPEITFETFVVGLSTEALIHLGEIPDPQQGKTDPDLPAAQQLIDIIGMLKEKTKGNLDHDEMALLDAILFELRMKYVERARQIAR